MLNSSLVTLKRGTHRIALFVISGLSGAATEVLPLAANMSCRNPILGLQARGPDGSEASLTSVEEMAQHYLQAIKAWQPQGPYLLAGYSFGGLVALEVALLLTKSGEQPALLAFLESYPHPQYWPLSVRLHLIGRLAKRRAAILLHSPLREFASYLAVRGSSMIRRVNNGRESGNGSGEAVFGWFRYAAPQTAPPQVRQIYEDTIGAFRQYRPKFYSGKVTFFLPQNSRHPRKNPVRMWRNWITEVEVHVVAGDHLSMVAADSADLASQLCFCISRALAGATSLIGRSEHGTEARAGECSGGYV
jgi:acetoacetyl-CoA synthetase